MDLDDPVCLCFHVTRRKIIRFIKVEKPRRASQLSECFGAGTGCGWCRPYLERLLDQHGGKTDPAVEKGNDLDQIGFEQYQADRRAYRAKLKSDQDSAAGD